MSIRMMIRKCKHCGHKYTYNPSIGDMGEFCPRCHMPQTKAEMLIEKDLRIEKTQLIKKLKFRP